MNKKLLICIALLCFQMQMNAQSLSEAEVVEKMNLAFELNKANRQAEALDAFLVVGKNTELQRTEAERQVYVCSQTMACKCLENLKRHKDAYLLAKKLIQGNINDVEKKDIAKLYVTNGYLYAKGLIKPNWEKKNDYRLGRDILYEIEPYADEKLAQYVYPRLYQSFYIEGVDCFSSQRFEEALNCYQQALEGFRKIGIDSYKISVLKAIASVKNYLYDFTGCKEAYVQALTLAKKNGKVSDQMDILKSLWSFGTSTGDMKIVRFCTASMDSLVEAAGDEKTRYDYYLQKGDEAKETGLYKLAEEWYMRGKSIAERVNVGTNQINRYVIYAKLRSLYIANGDYDHALEYGEKALVEYQSNYSADAAGYSMPYMPLADIYRLKDDKTNCFACIDSLFKGAEKITETKELCNYYVTRARCHAAFNNYAAALKDYQKADEMLGIQYSILDGDRTSLLALKGGMEYQLGRYVEMEQHYKQYAENIRNIYGESSMEYINSLNYLANANGFAGHIDEGCKNYMQATTRLKNLIKERVPYMNAEERTSFWNPVSSFFMNMTPYALQAKLYQTQFTQSCYDALVMSKAFLLESERSLVDVVKKEGSEEDMRDYMRLSLMKNQIKEWEKDYQHHADSILSMSQRADRIATRLSERCRSFGSITGFMDVDYNAIKQAMKPNEVLIDFTDFVSKTKGRRYAAYIINKTDEYPLLKTLFAENQIDSLGIVRPDMYYDEDYAPEILKLLWDPLKEHVAEGSTIYYVPSQLLFQVSLESLPLSDGSLLGDHYNFVRLSSARELLKKRSEALAAKPQTAVLYGGLKYDLQPTTMVCEAKKYDLSDLMVMRGDMVRGDSVFHELPGSKEEIIKIEGILKAKQWQVTPRMDMEGTEESFLSMHGNSPKILQIATHGFYYTPDRANDVDYLRGYTDAMLLSGLVLSGGNTAWLGKPLPEGVLGGILTANNIARLDLSTTDLVVLSACQSGQGKATSEGLYGLQRAFKKAGVGTIVMALWSVSDKVTTDFMVTFYEQLSSKECDWDKHKAFEQTKSIVRSKYPDPFLWAAFIMLD
ncbi:MAG: CHAT domain-containing protein [Bacteroidales bacterium]|nr:CHAT domain-containing protein [Bacteroidales bacterium]